GKGVNSWDFGRGDEGAVGHRNSDRLGLTAAHHRSVQAGRLYSVAAVRAGVVGRPERADDELAGTHRGDLGSDSLDDAAVFVSDGLGFGDRADSAVFPQV